MIYNRFRDIREDTDHTQIEIANLLQTTQSYYSQMEKGQHPISLDRAVQLADFYNISLDWLTGRTDRKEINK